MELGRETDFQSWGAKLIYEAGGYENEIQSRDTKMICEAAGAKMSYKAGHELEP